MRADDSVLTCTVIFGPGDGSGEGSADQRGCIAYEGFIFLRRWQREDGRIRLYGTFGDLLLTLRRDGRDTLRGRLEKSDGRVTLTRR